MCVLLKWRLYPSSESKYQKLDMGLRVSGGGKLESDVIDGWDNGWEDN